VATFGVETILKFETNAMGPSVMELVIDKHLEIDVTVVGEVNKLDFKEIPVVKSEVIGVYFFVQTQPSQRRSGFKGLLSEFEL